MKKNIKRCGATLLATTILFGSFPYSAMAWEDDTMKKLAEVALMTGEKSEVSENTEQNTAITRAEFMALVNRMLGFTEESNTVSQYSVLQQMHGIIMMLQKQSKQNISMVHLKIR